ncbi:hypothetical protein Tco_1106356 [Tanacetum coccineum]
MSYNGPTYTKILQAWGLLVLPMKIKGIAKVAMECSEVGSKVCVFKHIPVFNWETAKYGKIWYDEDVLDLRSVETENPAIVFNDSLTSNETPFCEPTVSYLNNNKIDFRISFEESDDEDYTIWYDEDVLDLRSVETEFPAIVFNDSLTSNETPSCEPTVSYLNNNEIDFRISFDESDDEDYTVVFNKNSFSYKIISTNDLKMNLENDNEKVNKPLFPSPEPSVSCIDDLDFFKDFENEIPAIVYNDALTSKSDFSTEPTLCPQHIDKFDLKDETSLSEYDEVEQSILYFSDLFPFNIVYPDDQKSDKGNDENEIDMIQSSRGNENTNKLLKESHDKIRKIFIMGSFVMELNENIVAWNHFVNGILFNLIKNLYVPFGILFDPKRIGDEMGLDVAGTLCFQLAGVRRSMTWRQFILALGLHTAKEMAEDGFGVYWSGSERLIPDKGDLSDYWVEISSGRDFLRGAPSYTYIRDPVQRLCHMLISYNFSMKGQAPEKVTATDLFYLRHLAHHFGLVSDDELRGLSIVARELPLIDIGELVKLNICMEIGDDWAWVAPGPERQQVAAAGAPKAAKDALVVDEGAQADPAPVQAPQLPPPPLAAGRTMPPRLGRLK